LSDQLDQWYWSRWWTDTSDKWLLYSSTALFWATWLLVIAYVVLALRTPARSSLDRLAGTYLVPR
jgi:hypothetical protein